MLRRTRLIVGLMFLLTASAAVLLFPAVASAAGQDGNVEWNQLYHAAGGVDPVTELVPGRTFHFREPAGTGVTLTLLSAANDLTAAKVRYWDGGQHWIDMGRVGTVNAAFRNQGVTDYDIWQVTIYPCGSGTVYYRFEVIDGERKAYLKAAGGDTTNPLGQHVRAALDDPDDYAFEAANVNGQCALWLDRHTIAWNLPAAASYKLLHAADGNVDDPAKALSLDLKSDGKVGTGDFPKNPNAADLVRLKLPEDASDAAIKEILKGEVAVASYDSAGKLVDATRAQVQGVLDDLYARPAGEQELGVTYAGGAPVVRVWAPTARSVVLHRYAGPSTSQDITTTMALDPASGVWVATGEPSWDRQFYLFEVRVYVPAVDQIVTSMVSDPYSVSLSADGAAEGDVRSQFANLADADLKPDGWDTLAKPPLAAPEDISVYEVHVRDFSISDPTVTNPAHRGGYLAFTYDGNDGRTLSAGMRHLDLLQAAGLTHIHLLPVFDFASVIEVPAERSEPAITFDPETDRASEGPQAAVGAKRATDGYNWGYDPFHYGAPEGSYATDANGTARIREFRQMVQSLARNRLRVVMDVAYNHTAASGLDDKSVLDKIVPGYYYRSTADGYPYRSSCCADTASEYAMMEKLMIDTVLRFATAYKVDGFRFDLMSFHTRQNMVDLQAAVAGLTLAHDGVDGSAIYLYGEGWDFGSAKEKGLTACPNCYGNQYNMKGTGIGTFNDKIRDAAQGGYNQDPTGIRHQGFINGLSYDWNGYCYGNRDRGDLQAAMGTLRATLKGSGDIYTNDPQETINYVEKHDNETLYDLDVFKLPDGLGAGLPQDCTGGFAPAVTSMADRVRVQTLGAYLVGLAQGIPFFQMGEDTLRSKSLDRNSFESGDWFNRMDWSLTSNNFGRGLPPAWDNQRRWSIMKPLLNDTSLQPTQADMHQAEMGLREALRIRRSSPLFRLRTETDADDRITFYNGDGARDGLIVVALSDGPEPDLDPNYEAILVFFNANKASQSFTVPGAHGFTLHPLQADAQDADPVVKTAKFDDAASVFTIPARTAAVFVSTQALPAQASSLDFVGDLYPRGGAANLVQQGAFKPDGFDVYVQVFEPGVTDQTGQGGNIGCTLRWGEYGKPWVNEPMWYNGDKDSNDEYRFTLPRATINALEPGTYGFTAYCRLLSESGKKWKQDNPSINDRGDGLFTVIPAADSAAERPGGVFVHLFEWRWEDIGKECSYLASKGYSAVQISPPMEHVIPLADMGGAKYPWWVRYQPVSYDLNHFTSRSGNLAQFKQMLADCNKVGVDIYADAVINHMAAWGDKTPMKGTAGTDYLAEPADKRFYGPLYAASDFHPDCDVNNYQNRDEVQRCKLSNLPDLDTGNPQVRAKIHAYLQSLLDIGVRGFRIDGGKHIAAPELAAILDGLKLPGGDRPYIYAELIDTNSSEAVRDWEYAPAGDVSEFEYSMTVIGNKFRGGSSADCNGHLSDLWNVSDYNNMMPSRFAVVFTDNHDNQRGHGAGGACIVDHRDGQLHVLANVFMLAYPYGYPMITSSYYWNKDPNKNTGDGNGPPSTTSPFAAGTGPETRPVYGPNQVAGDVPENCSPAAYEDGKWVCEHRRTAVANMVQFRQVTAGESLTNWQVIGNLPSDHIAFGRGSKGFVAINRSDTVITTTYTTSMLPGRYCDITKYDFDQATSACVAGTTQAPADGIITVDANSRIVDKALGKMDAFAIHLAARIGD